MEGININPYKGKIWIELIEMEAGGLSVIGHNIVSEKGKVIAVGEGVDDVGVGDTLYVKAWGLDHVAIDGKNYYVADIDSKAILGKELGKE